MDKAFALFIDHIMRGIIRHCNAVKIRVAIETPTSIGPLSNVLSSDNLTCKTDVKDP